MSRRERSLVIAVFFVSVALIASGIGMLMLWSTVKVNRGDINELEGQVRALGAIPITKQPPTPAEPPTTTITTTRRPVSFPPTSVGPPANPPAAAAQAPSPAPEPTTTTTAAPPPTTTTPPTTATPCTTIPVLGTCITTRASRSSTRGDTVQSTAYCLTGTMASGAPTHVGAVAGNAWPLGTVLDVSDSPYGPGRFTVEDRIGWGSELDFATPADCGLANHWGRQPVSVTVVA